MREVLLVLGVAGGGAIGALARHLIAELVHRFSTWPAFSGTLIANLLGCFGIGLVFAMLEAGEQPAWVRAVIVTGMLGAFTTFSTFSLEAMHMIHARRFDVLVIYVAGSVLIGLAAVKAGMLLHGAMSGQASG